LLVYSLVLLLMINSCREKGETQFTGEPGEIRLIILAPGHYHAHAVHRRMYDQVNPTVHIYAPEGPEVHEHVSIVESYNSRDEDPTSWNQVVYIGDDYLERMLAEKKGNVVILAGNNRRKTTYIKKAVDAGLNVLSDKPMAIDMENFELLRESFISAGQNDVLLYDLMTGRHFMGNIIKREIMKIPSLFGSLEKGSPENPAVISDNVHHFYRQVGGSLLYRPPWYFDVRQQGDGIVDVTTHLVDQVQWACFPGEIIDYRTDIEMVSAKRWPTAITRSQFGSITGEYDFPAYLDDYIENDTVIQVYANGEMNYILKGVHVRVGTRWHYSAVEGAGDAGSTLIRGSNANLITGQAGLCIEPANPGAMNDFESVLFREFASIQVKYPGVELKRLDNCWQVVIPSEYHADSFTQVTFKFLQYLIEGNLPEWEVPNMISRYYTTTRALEMAKGED
jgi:predicted dehydrogenase